MPPKSYDLGYEPYHAIRGFFKSQLTKTVLPPAGTSMAGRTAVVTGANSGLGYATADWFLELSAARLVMGVRTVQKGEAAADELRKKHAGANIDVWQVDMLSYRSIQEFAARCSGLERLDLVVLNAGIATLEYKLGPEGHGELLQVNYLSTVLLATLLLPTLRDRSPPGQPGRLTLVNSGLALVAKMPNRARKPLLPALDDQAEFDATESYSSAKALGHFWIVKLAERVSGEDVVVNLADPGLVRGTNLHAEMGGIIRAVLEIGKAAFGRTMRAGSSVIVDAAVVGGAETHGSFVMDWAIHRYCQLVYGTEGAELGERIWDETLEELAFADVKGVLNSMSR